MIELKKIAMFIILLVSINFGYCQWDHDQNVKTNPHQQVLLFTNSDSIVHSVPIPSIMANGITFDGNSLWVASTDYSLYKISPLDGSVQKTLEIEIESFWKPETNVELYKERIIFQLLGAR